MRQSSLVRKAAFWAPLVSIVLIWQILYLPHLRDSPSWYGDEVATFQMGRELVHGQTAYLSLWLTYWHNFLPYQPGYLLFSGLFSAATGGDILGARFFNALLAFGIALMVYFLGRSRIGILPAWLAALLFLTYEQNVIHFRWVYCHNAVAFGFAYTILHLLRPSRPKNDWRCGIGLAIGAMGHPLFAHGAIATLLCRLKRPGSWWRLALPSAIAIGITFLFIIWAYWPKPWLWNDLSSLAREYSGNSSENSGGAGLWENFQHFYTQDLFHFGALAGALACFARRRYYIIPLCLLTISILLLQNRQNLTVFYYQAIILAPVLVLAWAGGVSALGTFVRQKKGRYLQRMIFAVAFLVPIVFFAFRLPAVLQGKLIPRNQPWVTQRIPEVEYAAEWLNDRLSPDDLTIANINLAWLLHCRSADLLQATAWQESSAIFLGNSFTHERFRYPVDVDKAKFVVIGDIDQRWTLAQPNVDKVLARLIAEKWPVVWQGKYYTILGNPALIKMQP